MATTGHEDRFRTLFAQEAEIRLGRMSEDLLALEEGADMEERLASLFRDAHTLKGGAGMVGFPDVARLAHTLEDALEMLRTESAVPGAALVDVLLEAVDGLRAMTTAGVTGEPAAVDVAALERRVAAALADPLAGAVSEPPSAGTPSTRARSTAASLRVDIEDLDLLDRLVADTATGVLRVGHLLSAGPGDGGALALPEFRDLSRAVAALQERVMHVRLVAVSSIAEPLRRAVRDAGRATGRRARWELHGGETSLDRGVLDQLVDPLLHLVRNAVAHGIEDPDERRDLGKPAEGTVRLHALQRGADVVLIVADDGRGIDAEAVRRVAVQGGMDPAEAARRDVADLLFTTGLSTAGELSTLAGRGVGLDVVRAAVERVRGRVEVESTPGNGTTFRLVVPLTMSVVPSLIVAAGGRRYAMPLHTVARVVEADAIDQAGVSAGRQALWDHAGAIPVASLAAVLGTGTSCSGPALVVSGHTTRWALRIDELVGRRTVVVKELSRVVPRLDLVAGVSIEPDGSLVPVLDVTGVVRRAQELDLATPDPPSAAASTPDDLRPPAATILVVDDALTVRELQRSILERAGYTVRTATDGKAALAVLAEGGFDLVLADVEMPRMDGLELVRTVRQRPQLAGLPVVLLTARASEEDRRRGLEAGADSYIVKHEFDADALVGVVRRLLGDQG